MKRFWTYSIVGLLTFILGIVLTPLRSDRYIGVVVPRPSDHAEPPLTDIAEPPLTKPKLRDETTGRPQHPKTDPLPTSFYKRPFQFQSDSLNLNNKRFVFDSKVNTRK
jgi:hypothetical protein